ncbi:helix-turn-helix domain-containing protein [Roseovarius nanhaiticus]|nr:helix-turn-helix domain-containing protein [Roseovarius nanhaiticus]
MSDCALFSPRELAERSGWPERRIRSLIAAKQIKHLKIGGTFYLPEDAIADFVERNMVVPDGRDQEQVEGPD